MWEFLKVFFILIFGSCALASLMLDLVLLKISVEGVFPISNPSFNPAGHYPTTFPNPAGQS